MVVHKLLDAFFKTLDLVDAARDRVDELLGREPRPDPWAVDWPEPAADADANDSAASEVQKNKTAAPEDTSDKKTSGKKTTAKKKAGGKKTTAKKKADAEKTSAKKKASGKRAAVGRKGSVDRKGAQLHSERASAVAEYVSSHALPVIDVDGDYQGKKVLGRVLWALAADRAAGGTEGLTTSDVSALMHLSAGIEVFSTNISRACRDHSDLISPTTPQGRSKRFTLTEAGQKAAASMATD